MARSFWDRVLSWIGFEIEEDPVEEAAAAREPASGAVAEEWIEDMPHGGKKRGTLVSLPGQKQVKVVVVEPRSFEEVQSIADHLKQRRPIILNLEGTDREHAQRVLNFLSGTIYALNGEMQRISNGIFFFAPNNIDVALMRKSLKASEDVRVDPGRDGGRDALDRTGSLNLGSLGPVSGRERFGRPEPPMRMEMSGPRPEDDHAMERTLPLWHK